MEEIEGNLETNKAQLELNAATNPGVIEQYERRQKEVRKLNRSMIIVVAVLTKDF